MTTDEFVVVASKPKYSQIGKNGMMVRMRSQDYIDMAKVCNDANVRFCDLLHNVVRYAMDHLKIVHPEDEEGKADDHG